MTQAQASAELRDRDFARTFGAMPNKPIPLFTQVMGAADRCPDCGNVAVNTAKATAAYLKLRDADDISEKEAWPSHWVLIALAAVLMGFWGLVLLAATS